MLISKTLRLFLDGLGRREEYEHYLNYFQASDGGTFAALVPDLASLEQSADLIAFDLSFLLKLELIPLVLLCGPSAPVMAALLQEHMDDVWIHSAAFDDALLAQTREGIEKARSRKAVPVLVVENAEVGDVLLALVPEIFQRVHLLRAQGGLRDESGNFIPYHWLKGASTQTPAGREKDILALAARCLAACPVLHVAVGSPLNLMKELFTVRGAGSVIRRGSEIRHVEQVGEVDVDRLLALLNESFGKKLIDQSFLNRVDQFYIEKDYRGAALLEPHDAGRYLTKFAVGMQARGEGLALELWNAIVKDHAALFWRSRDGNPINGWYDRQADGRQRLSGWCIYWRGIAPENISSIINFAATRPEDFLSER